MFGLSRKPKEDPLNEVIDSLTGALYLHEPETEEYAAIVTQLDRVYKMKTTQRQSRVSPDTIAIVVGNLAGILIIVMHERMHVMNSKALNFLKQVPANLNPKT